MKNRLSALLVALFTVSIATFSFAQDDLYYNPSEDDAAEATYTYEADEYEEADMEEYDEYEYLDDYDYHYSSRIRRFNRPSSSFGYYAPLYTDAAYYNRRLSPGVSIYVGNPFSYNSYRRASRNNFFNSPYGFSNFGFNNPYGRTSGYSPFYNPYSSIGNTGFGFNNPYGRSVGGGYNAYCPPTSYGTASRTARGSSNNTYGPRGTSSSTSRSYDSTVRRGTKRNSESVRGSSTTRSRTSGARSNSSNRRTYDRGTNNSRRNYTPRRSSSSTRTVTPSRSSSRSYSTPSRSSSRSYSTPSRSSSRSISTPSRSSSRRNN